MTVKTVRQVVVDAGDEAIRAFLEELRTRGIETTVEQAEQISSRMREMMGYRPKVGFFGKTGVGKSSLCNALFGADVADVSDVDACTRDANEYLMQIGGSAGIVLVDVPGVGESIERDREYHDLYRELIPTLDVLVWVVKADDRAFTTEQRFYREVVQPHLGKTPLVVAINQADKIEPVRNWDVQRRMPGPDQLPNLERKREVVREIFTHVPPHRIVPVAAAEHYQIGRLLESIVEAVDRSKRIGVLREAREEAKTEKVVEAAEKGFLEEAWETVKKVARQAAALAASIAAESFVRSAGKALRRWLRW